MFPRKVKELSFFSYTSEKELFTKNIDAALEELQFVPLKMNDEKSKLQALGFASVFNAYERAPQFQYKSNGLIFMIFRSEEKVSKPGIRNKFFDERVAAYIERTNVPYNEISKKLLKEMREESDVDAKRVGDIKSSSVPLIINTKTNHIYVLSASENDIKQMQSKLCDAFDCDLKMSPVVFQDIPARLTAWINEPNIMPDNVDFSGDADFQGFADNGKKNTVKVKKQDMGGEEIAAILQSGKTCVALGLEFKDTLSFNLIETTKLKSVKNISDGQAALDAESFEDELMIIAQDIEDVFENFILKAL